MAAGQVAIDIERGDRDSIDQLGRLGAATVHEAMGRRGLLMPALRPLFPAAIAGAALTCSVAPGDNWMIHVALEQAQRGDILVVAPTSPCSDGYFGDLLATSAMARGIAGLVIDGGVRDVATLREMGFPVWSRAIFAQGTVKATLGEVQFPLLCAGGLIHPGDAVVADEDGICIVPRLEIPSVLDRALARAANEEEKRLRYAAGELSLDINAMSKQLEDAGLRYVRTGHCAENIENP